MDTSEVSIRGDMVAHPRQVAAVVDSSKWERVGFVSFPSIDQLDCIITDAGAPPDMIAVLREAGVDVVIV